MNYMKMQPVEKRAATSNAVIPDVCFYAMHGLGNQLFQYAAAIAVAQRQGCDAIGIDLSHFASGFRHYELNRVIQKRDCALPKYSALHRVRDMAHRIVSAGRRHRYGLPVFHCGKGWDGTLQDVTAPVFLLGGFGSPRHFRDYEDFIRRRLTMVELTEQEAVLAAEIRQYPSCSIHFRRTDYLSNPKAGARFTTLDESYYQAAIETVKAKFPELRFFVFSDAPDEATRFFSGLRGTRIVKQNAPLGDMLLMARCNANIIANSTFSWWGAWIGDDGSKLIIAPREWLRTGSVPDDFVPNRWTRI